MDTLGQKKNEKVIYLPRKNVTRAKYFRNEEDGANCVFSKSPIIQYYIKSLTLSNYHHNNSIKGFTLYRTSGGGGADCHSYNAGPMAGGGLKIPTLYG